MDEERLASINPHESVYNDDTEWPEGYDPRQHGFLYLGEDADCRYENLRGFDFSILDCIDGSDFTGANLKDCSFRNMEIENVCFESIVERTNFIGTRARNCTFSSLYGLILVLQVDSFSVNIPIVFVREHITSMVYALLIDL